MYKKPCVLEGDNKTGIGKGKEKERKRDGEERKGLVTNTSVSRHTSDDKRFQTQIDGVAGCSPQALIADRTRGWTPQP